MEKENIRKLLKPIIWDYHTDPYEVFEAASGRKERAGYFTQETALVRMLERLSWYDLINLFGRRTDKTPYPKDYQPDPNPGTARKI